MDELTHKRVLAAAAIVAWAAQALYILSPFDLLPDFIPLIGWVDDLIALVGLGATTLWMVRTVREVGLPELLGSDAKARVGRRAVDRDDGPVVYEPLSVEAIRSL